MAEVVKHFGKPAGITLPLVEPTPLTTTFQYDECNKLTGITNPDLTTETMTYDDNGQLIRREKYAVGGDGFGDGSGNGSGNGEAGGSGSPVEVTEYEWNDQGMLVKVILPGGEPVEYRYDGNQRLTGRKSADGVDQFVQSGWDIMTKTDDVGKRTYYTGMSAVSGGMSEVSGAGSSSGSFVSGFSSGSSSGSSVVENGDSVKYFHYNHRGDTVLVTDSEGNILNNFSYEAYGKPTNSEGIPVNNLSIKNIPNLFIGGSGIRYEFKTDLHYMRFRWFSQEQMRFISPDLLMDLNRYAYVSGNPVTRIDPSGLEYEEQTRKFWEAYIKANPPSVGSFGKYTTSNNPPPIPRSGFHKIMLDKDRHSLFIYAKEASRKFDIPLPVVLTMLHFENRAFTTGNPILKKIKMKLALIYRKGSWCQTSVGIAQIKVCTVKTVQRYYSVGQEVELSDEELGKLLLDDRTNILLATQYLAYLRDEFAEKYPNPKKFNLHTSMHKWTAIISMYNTGFNSTFEWRPYDYNVYNALYNYMEALEINKIPSPRNKGRM